MCRQNVGDLYTNTEEESVTIEYIQPTPAPIIVHVQNYEHVVNSSEQTMCRRISAFVCLLACIILLVIVIATVMSK